MTSSHVLPLPKASEIRILKMTSIRYRFNFRVHRLGVVSIPFRQLFVIGPGVRFSLFNVFHVTAFAFTQSAWPGRGGPGRAEEGPCRIWFECSFMIIASRSIAVFPSYLNDNNRVMYFLIYLQMFYDRE